jgi:hypothetical protein
LVELTVVFMNLVDPFTKGIVFPENAREPFVNVTVALESGIVAPRSHSRRPMRRENEPMNPIRSVADPMNALVSSLVPLVSSIVGPSRRPTRFIA